MTMHLQQRRLAAQQESNATQADELGVWEARLDATEASLNEGQPAAEQLKAMTASVQPAAGSNAAAAEEEAS